MLVGETVLHICINIHFDAWLFWTVTAFWTVTGLLPVLCLCLDWAYTPNMSEVWGVKISDKCWKGSATYSVKKATPPPPPPHHKNCNLLYTWREGEGEGERAAKNNVSQNSRGGAEGSWPQMEHWLHDQPKIGWHKGTSLPPQMLLGVKAVSKQQFSSSSRRYLHAQESTYVLHPLSLKFPQHCLWNGSSVRLFDDGPLLPFQGRSSSTPFQCLSAPDSVTDS